MPTLIEMTGKTFGRWTVLERAPNRRKWEKDARWLCRCVCGTENDVNGHSLRSGLSLSCGCLNLEIIRVGNLKHGRSKSPEYNAWYAMKQRCSNPNHIEYRHYGGRGIRVSDLWVKNFEAFFAEVGLRPSPRYSLDRIDNSGHYEPGNVRWATVATQQSNKRSTHFIIYRGVRMSITQAVRLAGNVVYPVTANGRIRRGWDADRAIETPALR